ncbi:hypothetical protein BDF21DRAFT_52369 [Thamnidium elegans]|nr:hypothetical protein BDF21DRAFT_52369 [Thamnidium elegans]
MKTENSTNIHVFRVNRAAVTTKIKEPPTQTTLIKVNSRTSLSAETKRLICEDHINNPKYTQEALASKYGCKRTTVAKIIKSRNRWLSIDSDAAIAKRFRQRSSRYPHVENALLLWVQKEFSDITLVTDQMLRSQARQYAQAFHQRYITPKSRGTITPPPTLLLENNIPTSSDIQISKVSHDMSSVVEFNATHNNTLTLDPVQVTNWNLPPASPNQNLLSCNIKNNCPRDEGQPLPNQSMKIKEDTSIKLVQDEDMVDTYQDISSPCYSNHEVNTSPDTHQESPRPDSNQLVEPTIENLSPTLTQENTKLCAKQHLEAALAFYTSQNETNQSMSANMIKLILENDF